MSIPFFSQIYRGEVSKDYGDVIKNFAEKNINSFKPEKQNPNITSEADVLSPTQEEIEQLLAKSRAQPDKAYTQEEAAMAKKFIDDLKIECPIVRKDIFDFKSSLHNDIMQQTDKFSLDISNNVTLKNYAYEVFETSKNKITYEDYIVLLELKKQIETKEQADMILEEENGIFE